MRRRILDAARACGEAVSEDAIYAASQGPRLETAAEIDRLERDGADVVGMTGMPEAALAREAGLEYATIAVIANFAAGRGDSLHSVRMEDIEQVLQQSLVRVRRVIEQLVAAMRQEAGRPARRRAMSTATAAIAAGQRAAGEMWKASYSASPPPPVREEAAA